MKLFRKIGPLVYAFQVDGTLRGPLIRNYDNDPNTPDKISLLINGKWINVKQGDWIIGNSEIGYSVYPDRLFKQLYEEYAND